MLKQKIYEAAAEKKKDFWLGVGLFFGLNIVLALCSWGLTAAMFSVMYAPDGTNTMLADIYPTISCVLGALPLIVNIGLIIYFAATRSQIALGMLAGFGIAFVIVICLGVIFMTVCFVGLASYSQ